MGGCGGVCALVHAPRAFSLSISSPTRPAPLPLTSFPFLSHTHKHEHTTTTTHTTRPHTKQVERGIAALLEARKADTFRCVFLFCFVLSLCLWSVVCGLGGGTRVPLVCRMHTHTHTYTRGRTVPLLTSSLPPFLDPPSCVRGIVRRPSLTTNAPSTRIHTNSDFPQRLAYEQLLLRGESDNAAAAAGQRGKRRAPTFDPSVLERAYERVVRQEEKGQGEEKGRGPEERRRQG